jgi:hypothetical protein
MTRKKSWRDILPVHPAAELFPLMSKAELRELAPDIKANTLQVPIVLWSADRSLVDGLLVKNQTVPKNLYLLDGRNRLDALELNGVKLVTDDGKFNWLRAKTVGGLMHVSKDDDPYAYVVSVNIRRRHLTPEQKRDLIVKLLKADPSKSNRQIAKQAQRDDKTVAKVRTELESTADIPQLKKTKGKDGKERPAKRKPVVKSRATELTPSRLELDADGRLSMPDRLEPKLPRRSSPQAAHKPAAAQAIDISSMASAWREVEAQAAAGNVTRYRIALENLHAAVSISLRATE